MSGRCEVCGGAASNCSPFRDDDDGRQWESVCGGCKIRLTLASPARRAAIERDLRLVTICAARSVPQKGGAS